MADTMPPSADKVRQVHRGVESVTAADLVAAVFRELPDHDQDDPDGYTCTPLPVLEAECAWRGTGYVHVSYSDGEIAFICRAVAAQVALSLAVAGYLRQEPEGV